MMRSLHSCECWCDYPAVALLQLRQLGVRPCASMCACVTLNIVLCVWGFAMYGSAAGTEMRDSTLRCFWTCCIPVCIANRELVVGVDHHEVVDATHLFQPLSWSIVVCASVSDDDVSSLSATEAALQIASHVNAGCDPTLQLTGFL